MAPNTVDTKSFVTTAAAIEMQGASCYTCHGNFCFGRLTKHIQTMNVASGVADLPGLRVDTHNLPLKKQDVLSGMKYFEGLKMGTEFLARAGCFPFMKLPIELRREIYGTFLPYKSKSR
jgi:hypothetical protein